MRLNRHYFLRKIGDLCFLQASNGIEKTMIFLNETSVFLLENMETSKTIQELVKNLTEEYDVKQTTAVKDVKEFISFLIENGCIDMEERDLSVPI